MPAAAPRARPRDDYDDEPARPQRPQRRRSRDDDYDDYEPPPRGRRRRSRSGKKGLIIGLSVGGSILVIGVIVLLIVLLSRGGTSESTEKLLIGTWQEENMPFGFKVEFAADGTVTDTQFLVLKGKYRVIDAHTVEVEDLGMKIGDAFKGMGGPAVPPGFGDMKMGGLATRWTVSVGRNEMTIQDPMKGNLIKHYRRIK
jgi:hypothetical protein